MRSLQPPPETLPTGQPVYVVPFFGTPSPAIGAALDLAELKPGEVFCDLGAGDGRMLFAAARRGAQAVGVELNIERIEGVRKRVAEEGLNGRVYVTHGDLYRFDYVSQADVVYAFLDDKGNRLLRSRLEMMLTPRTRVVTLSYRIPGWKLVKVVKVTETVPARTLYLYVFGQHVPAGSAWQPPKGKMLSSSYTRAGLSLAFSGILLAAASFLLLSSVPLTALGASMIILGSVLLALSRGLPTLSPQATSALMESGLRNVSAIIEELGLSSKAVYLPSPMTGGAPKALIPLHSNPSSPRPEKPLPERFVVKYGAHPEDLGVLVTTPGSVALAMLDSRPGPSAADMESALTSTLAGGMGLVDAVKVSMSGQQVTVELANPRLAQENLWVYRLLGSSLASIVASIAAEALEKPVLVEREEHMGTNGLIELRVMD